jgi:hypothetical protein
LDSRNFLRISYLAVACAIVSASSIAKADDDTGASIFTENGYELKRDDRIVTLFAALNAAGYDRGEITRAKPFPRYSFHPLREKVRQSFGTSTDKLRAPVDKFMDAHPESIEAYVGAALTLGDDAPFAPSDATPQTFGMLDRLLADFATNAKLAKTTKTLTPEYRELFKKLKGSVDAPFAQLRAAYRLDEEDAPSLVLVPNPLDGPESAVARTVEETHFVVFGVPANESAIDLKPALQAYSELLAAAAVGKTKTPGLDDALGQLKSRGSLAPEVQAENAVRESLRFAVESKLWAKDATGAVNAAFVKGYVYAPEFLKALAEPAESFPSDKGSFAAQVVARVDLKKALTDVLKAPTVK